MALIAGLESFEIPAIRTKRGVMEEEQICLFPIGHEKQVMIPKTY